MDVLVNVSNQKLKIATNLKSFVEGISANRNCQRDLYAGSIW